MSGPSTPERMTLTVPEAAALLGCASNTLYEAIARNEFPHVRVSRRILIPTAALDRWLDPEGTTPPDPSPQPAIRTSDVAEPSP